MATYHAVMLTFPFQRFKVCAMPNTKPEIVDSKAMELVTGLSKKKARCDYGIYYGASSDNADAIAKDGDKAVSNRCHLATCTTAQEKCIYKYIY